MKATQLGFDAQGEATDIADEAQQAIYAATANSRRAATPTAGGLLEETFDWLESDDEPGLSTGFADVDKLVGGLQPGNMVIIAARPGVGKSTFAMDIARHAALHNRVPTLFVSLEMSQRELMLRLLAAESSVPLQALKDRKLDPRQWDTISKRSTAIQDAPLWLEDQPGVTPLELRSKARQLKRQGLGLIVLDYLQSHASVSCQRFVDDRWLAGGCIARPTTEVAPCRTPEGGERREAPAEGRIAQRITDTGH